MFVKGYRHIFREAKLKTHYVEWGEGLGHMHAQLYCPAISASKGPFPASVLHRSTLMLYVGRRLQLFQQSLSRAMITNDSVSGRKSSPWQIDSKTQATGWRKAEAVLREEEKKNGIKRHIGIILRVSSGVATVGEGKAERSARL